MGKTGGSRANGPMSTPQLEREYAEKARKVFELRLAGATFTQIAERVGYAQPSAAYKTWQREIANIPRSVVDEARRLEESRLDTMLTAVWPAVLRGQLGAIDRALAISTRRARLLGLDAPVKVTGTLTDALDEEVTRLVEAMTGNDPALREVLEANARDTDGG